MFKALQTKMMLLLGLMLAGAGSAWAEEVTFSAGTEKGTNGTSGNSDTMTKDGITVSGTDMATTTAQYRVYAGSKLTISSTVGNITKIVLTSTAKKDSNYGLGSLSTSNFTASATDYTGTWYGSASSIEFSASKQVRLTKIVVTYEAQNSNKSDAEISFASETVEVELNDVSTFSGLSLNNPNGLTIQYSSSNVAVAAVDAEGVVSLTGETGEARISADFLGDDEYRAASVSYTITVYDATQKVATFNFSEDYGQTFVSTNVYEDEPFEYQNGDINLYVEGQYRFWDNDKTLRLYKGNNDYDAAQMMLTAPAGYEISKIEFDANINATADLGTVSGKVWTGSENSVLFTATATTTIKTITVTYSKITQLTATVTAAGWATFVPKYNVKAEGVKAYVVALADKGMALLEQVSEIPAGTPVLIEGEGTYTLEVVESAAAVGENCLEVSDGTIAAAAGVYVLAQKNGNTGFYLWTGDALAKGKVYLKIEDAARQMLRIVKPGEATAVEGIAAERAERTEGIYNLQGQRIGEPAKGLYIVSGKKIIK